MRRFAVVLLAATLATGALARGKAPKNLKWAMDALETDAAFAAGAGAVILLRERTVTPVGNAGKVRLRYRTVLRILSSEGLNSEDQVIHYSKTRRLDWFQAWTIRPDGSVQEIDKSLVQDHGTNTYASFSDSRARVLPLPNVGVGSAIVVEYVIEREDPVLQDLFRLQWYYPVALARVVLDIPETWDFESKFMNIAPMDPVRDGRRLVWEVRNLPGLEGTSYAAPRADTAASLALSYYPRTERKVDTFRRWEDVSSWADGVFSSQATADDEIRSTVSRLTAASPDPTDTIRAIGRYVQDLRYVTINLGNSGYVPHPPPDVNRNRYGDCKDKATLMMTMLREAVIASHPILVDTRSDGKVFPEFPSPRQFNHVVLGIPVDEDPGMEAVAHHDGLGRLLVFDPTDDQTPLGDFPWSDQGTRGLLLHPEKGGLVELPALPSSASRAERDWTVTVEKDGRTVVTLEGTFTGQYARLMRGRFAGRDEAKRMEALGRSLSRRVPGAHLYSVSFENLSSPELPVLVRARAEVPRFGRLAGALRLVEPMKFLESLAPTLPEDPGGLPVLIPFLFQEVDRFHLELPSRWQISEPPADLEMESDVGRLALRCRKGEDGWLLERELSVETLEIPLDGYSEARTFLDKAADIADTPVVLESVGP